MVITQPLNGRMRGVYAIIELLAAGMRRRRLLRYLNERPTTPGYATGALPGVERGSVDDRSTADAGKRYRQTVENGISRREFRSADVCGVPPVNFDQSLFVALS